MKYLSVKQLSGLVIVIMMIQVAYLFFSQNQNLRFPANNSESPNFIFFKDSYINKDQSYYYFKTTNEDEPLAKSCAVFDRVEFAFEAEDIASFSGSDHSDSHGTDSEDGKVKLIVKLDCIRATSAPIFYASFCEGSGAESYEEGVEFQMLNDPGFFPRSWYLKKATLSSLTAKEVYTVPKQMFDLFRISCDE